MAIEVKFVVSGDFSYLTPQSAPSCGVIRQSAAINAASLARPARASGCPVLPLPGPLNPGLRSRRMSRSPGHYAGGKQSQAIATCYEVENREFILGVAMRRLTHMYSRNSYRIVQTHRTLASSARSSGCRSYFEAESSHAAPVLVDGALALYARVGSGREQHALVALRFLLFAYAARLTHNKLTSAAVGVTSYSMALTLTLGLEAAASELAAALLFAPDVREAASRAVVSSKLPNRTPHKLTHVESLRGHIGLCVVRWFAADELVKVITEDDLICK